MSIITNVKKDNGLQGIYSMDIYGITYPIVNTIYGNCVEIELPKKKIYYGCNNSFETHDAFKEHHEEHLKWINSNEYIKKKENEANEKKERHKKYIKKMLNKKRKREQELKILDIK